MISKGTIFVGNEPPFSVRQYEPPTFSVLASNVIMDLTKSMISIMNNDGSSVIRIKSIKLINIATASLNGVNAEFRFNRITSHVSGTDLTSYTFDTRDTLVSGITFKTGATVAGITGPLLRYYWNSDEVGQGAQDLNANQHTMQNLIPCFVVPLGTKPLTIRSGEGFSLVQMVNSNQGLFDIEVIFVQDV